MLSTFSPYSPQAFMPQPIGLPGASPAFFAQPAVTYPGAYNGATPFAFDPIRASYLQSPFAPYAYGQPLTGTFAGPTPVLQIVGTLGQLAQQTAVHGTLSQQIAVAIYQLAQQLQLVQQLAVQGIQTPAITGLGALAQSPFVQSPFAVPVPGAYAGFTPQTPAWGANRQTIQ